MWPGDWSGGGVSENYNASVNGRTCLQVQALALWPYWLPYAPLNAQGVPAYDDSANSYLILIMKPYALTDALGVNVYVTGGPTGDSIVGSVQLQPYFVSTDANGFTTYAVPLSALKAAGIVVRKILLQDSGCPIGQSFDVEYAAFV
jgi:hypothetical protein